MRIFKRTKPLTDHQVKQIVEIVKVLLERKGDAQVRQGVAQGDAQVRQGVAQGVAQGDAQVRQASSKPMRIKNTRWTPEDDAKLKMLYKQGYSYKMITKKFDRSYHSIQCRLHRLRDRGEL